MKKHLTIKHNKFSTLGKAFLLVMTFIACAGNGFAQKAVNQFAHLNAAQTATVKSYIGQKKNLRPAMRVDCKNKFGLESLRQSAGNSAHPYFAAADFNRDDIADFAIVLHDSSRAADARFTILIFNGTKAGAYQLASTTTGADLRQGGIWTYGFGTDETKTSITAGVYETDDCIWLEWENGKYVAHECSAVEN